MENCRKTLTAFELLFWCDPVLTVPDQANVYLSFDEYSCLHNRIKCKARGTEVSPASNKASDDLSLWYMHILSSLGLPTKIKAKARALAMPCYNKCFIMTHVCVYVRTKCLSGEIKHKYSKINDDCYVRLIICRRMTTLWNLNGNLFGLNLT